jgi:hypothetical protein
MIRGDTLQDTAERGMPVQARIIRFMPAILPAGSLKPRQNPRAGCRHRKNPDNRRGTPPMGTTPAATGTPECTPPPGSPATRPTAIPGIARHTRNPRATAGMMPAGTPQDTGPMSTMQGISGSGSLSRLS